MPLKVFNARYGTCLGQSCHFKMQDVPIIFLPVTVDVYRFEMP